MKMFQYAGYFLLVPIILSVVVIMKKFKNGDKSGAYREIIYNFGLALVALAAITNTWLLAFIAIILILLPMNVYRFIKSLKDSKKQAN